MIEAIDAQYRIPFPREQVYAAWVSSDTVIAPATAMDVLPEVPGHYRLFMRGDGFEARCEGAFELVEPGARVRYSWEWNGDGEVTTIDVRFADDADGTLVTLRHEGFAKADSRSAHASGWDAYVEGFTAYLAAAG